MVSSRLGGVAVAERVPLAPLTTLRVGPVARRLITAETTEQIIAVIRALNGDRALVLAGGSNVVLADDIPELTVVRLANTGISIDGHIVRAEAGAVWDDVVVAAIEHGLGGLECLSGIPGSAGATPVQNVGAYGAEVADTIQRVRLLDRATGEDRWVDGAELEFGYRTSVLKHSDANIVLEVSFALHADGRSAPLRYGELTTALGAQVGARSDPAAVRKAVLALRARKGMVLDEADHDTWSVGSFFTNPVVTAADLARIQQRSTVPVPNYPAPNGVKLAAGWLVEHAGFGKGYPGDEAPVRLSTKHALALTNRGHATAADVIALARTVREGVKAEFGIELTPEPTLVGTRL
ncbi:UDP-N-acetylmuramate dehydrogenase [Mycobacterium sp. 1274761.0]|uniref:UDP-N-acetylmuramate dehydrogenase n=1 Tax=Mycobacterium sp. 1274761.0 TaxID=1834077 RepID=UPI0007FC00B9|nr:UDP-N-acetylmuramate dehydrogenase [Mycobacterium sp. 1274761.0]OBK70784.1 UDP-N-acetylenolpyruvoylglucosamine reductase [Mycobacterium sp. 1274761.0]